MKWVHSQTIGYLVVIRLEVLRRQLLILHPLVHILIHICFR